MNKNDLLAIDMPDVVEEFPNLPEPIFAKTPTKSTEIVDIRQEVFDKDLETDFDYGKRNVRQIIEAGMVAINAIVETIEQDNDHIDFDSPKRKSNYFEELSMLLKTVTDANKDLLSLYKEKKNISTRPEDSTKKNDGVTQTNNIIFSGTTSDMAELIKNIKKDS